MVATLLLGGSASLLAQSTQLLTGRVVKTDTNEPLEGVLVSLTRANQITTTQADGTFIFRGVPQGQDEL